MTVWYWFEGVDETRPGGPWWHRYFEEPNDAASYLDDLRPFLHAYALDDAHMCSGRGCWASAPPPSAEVEVCEPKEGETVAGTVT